MKKLFSILFAAMILLSGMNLSFAKHICGGEISAVKLSVTDEKASCSMEMTGETNSNKPAVSPESCCKDEMSFLTVDKNYNPSTLQINEPTFHLLQVFLIPENVGSLALSASFSRNTNVQPPGKYIASAVSLPDICVFLI